MRVEETKYSITEIAHWVRTRDLIVNKSYQRGAELWPNAAKSYFIDTILREFPFPKIYFHEMVDREQRKPKREIVDGQQRVGAIVDFLDNKLVLGQNALEFSGKTFQDLSEDQQEAFYAYTVSVDVIRNADRASILQMFRRMNAYTLPLNEAEKRQAEFFGEFKSWINTTLDEYESIFVDWGLFTTRQVIRMADAELLADLALAVQEGIISTSPKKLKAIYAANDTDFPLYRLLSERVEQTLAYIRAEMSFIQKTFLMKPHMFHSLFCALVLNRWGLQNGEALTGLEPIGSFAVRGEAPQRSLIALGDAYEEKELSKFPEFVRSASEGGNRANQRAIRVQ